MSTREIPREILKFSFSKTHIWRNLWENIRTEMNQNLWWKCTCKSSRHHMLKEWLLQAFYSCVFVKRWIWISAVTLLQTKTQPLEHTGTPNCWFPLHRPCVRRGILDLEIFLSIYDTLIECCRYTWEIRPVYTWNTRILVRVYKTMENSKVTVYYYIHVTQIYCGIS